MSTMSALDQRVRRHPLVADALLAGALALVLGPTTVSLVWRSDWPESGRVAVLVVALVAHVSVIARRWNPAAAYLSCCLAMLALVAAPEITTDVANEFTGQVVPPILLPSSLVFVVVLYSVAAWGPSRQPTLALVIGLVGAGLATIRLSTGGAWTDGGLGQSGGGQLFVLAAMVAAVLAPWGFGRLRSVRTASVEQDRADQAARAVSAERARIAREMHDVVAHSLAVIVRQAEGGRYAAAKDPQRAAEALQAVATTGRAALADMRSVLDVLRHEDEQPDGAPQPTIEDVPALVDRVRGTGLEVALTETGEAAPLERAVSLAAYRVVQEALTNVVKHAGPNASATVLIDWRDSSLQLSVQNDGWPGRDPGEPAGRGRIGRGLVGMRERVSLAGGRLSAEPRGDADGRGFTVMAELPTRAGKESR